MEELHSPGDLAGIVRLPPGVDVPLTSRVRRLIDTPAMRRLSQVSQLGLVQLVYPGAAHSRFEHSLGVYGIAIEFLRQLARDSRFVSAVSPDEANRFLAAAVLHDVGHWPYCHPIEDLRLPEVERHEALARAAIISGEVTRVLEADWGLDPASVADTISCRGTSPGERIIGSMLSGPIDVDKIDYLARDSHHAGVPYGRHFDAPRLMSSLCLNAAGTAIAVNDKGRTAAELMVFARYVMFSEVYWHHAVRSATAMLQRGVFMLAEQLDWKRLYRSTDSDFPAYLLQSSAGTPAESLIYGLFGPQRQLYKRLAQYSFVESPEVYQRLARKPYAWLVEIAGRLAGSLSTLAGREIAPQEVLIDAPPVQTEVQCDLDVYFLRTRQYRGLRDVSPVVDALAQRQFDDYVKRVRVYVHPRLASSFRDASIDDIVVDVTGETA